MVRSMKDFLRVEGGLECDIKDEPGGNRVS